MWWQLERQIGVVVDETSPYFRQAIANVKSYRREPYPLILVLMLSVFASCTIMVIAETTFVASTTVFFLGIGIGVWLAYDNGANYSNAIATEIDRLKLEGTVRAAND